MGSASTALQALEMIAAHQPLGVSELARRLGVSKPTGQRAIQSLAAENWIRRSDTHPGRWVLTPKVLGVALHVGQEAGLRELALPQMNVLAAATTESVHLAVLDGAEIVVVEEVESTQVVRIHWPVGNRSPVHASANGKAILAALPREQVEGHLPARLEAFTAETITDRRRFLAELDRTAERGYAVQRAELRPDVAAVAAAISPQPHLPVGAVGLFLPIQRFHEDEEERLGLLVRAAADAIAAELAKWAPGRLPGRDREQVAQEPAPPMAAASTP
jgi:IclR family acetate operon transcriptional repressor